ncbi:hypothetical protein [Salmonella phage SS9]|uniref:Uncharacterized protein n=3 Tax=Kuttervirus TaxID=2169536 RepID=W8JE28_9CAUD|nr:hypothetical protein DF52_gp122 [Salmonella phage vB-SalM-SJ2]YP_009883122.1 hypothetical protein HYP88_gp033 [Salmonella phage SS9]AHK61472.1 hypothetical protein [Salmonella phage vB-SalM-SJ2]QEI24142.1 hypothetical protein [Salmonella phage SS3]QEI24198.1 hypothetical protein [Salmonella phage SS9]
MNVCAITQLLALVQEITDLVHKRVIAARAMSTLMTLIGTY